MRPETAEIWKLAGKLIEEVGSQKTSNTTQGSVPKAVADKVRSFRRDGFGSPIWTNADFDILAMVAMAELLWENRLEPLRRLDETELQEAMGANVFSKADTQNALARMRKEMDDMKVIHAQCEALPGLALAVLARTALGGPVNASQISFDKLGAEQVRKKCERNRKTATELIGKLGKVIPLNEQALRVL
jgi:hypothetical protein